jgi:lysyl-tRNA synthetase class 2
MVPVGFAPSAGRLRLRAEVTAAIRLFFSQNGYLEVETPLRIPAPVPEVHIDVEPSGLWYLQPSPEVCMKRLLAGGVETIFQICKCFRHGERGRRHLPEMTMVEWYTAHRDYTHMMAQCEALLATVMQALGRGSTLTYQGRAIDMTPPWPRLSVAEAFARYGRAPVTQALLDDSFDEIMGLEIEPRLGWPKPVFLCDYPAQCGALARLKPGDPSVVERFELYIGGLELCNAFSELVDPEEQRRRFENDIARRRALSKPVYPLPEKFLAAMENMPPATGNALGLDRLVMLLADTDTIDDVVAFTPETL